ncbi:hypothetical protein [Streptomyces sp. SID5473]|uniref:hypothetical protein n=1 Tax=Streptomyces sp. SID5473 TaxID=2690299 RepID=UPI00025CE6F0|nr:hypothetical protein [Streptomyces sp. SID5473]EIF93029.1 hypothetical protein [Streptomyces tsukubensis NRRL18488]
MQIGVEAARGRGQFPQDSGVLDLGRARDGDQRRRQGCGDQRYGDRAGAAECAPVEVGRRRWFEVDPGQGVAEGAVAGAEGDGGPGVVVGALAS